MSVCVCLSIYTFAWKPEIIIVSMEFHDIVNEVGRCGFLILCGGGLFVGVVFVGVFVTIFLASAILFL